MPLRLGDSSLKGLCLNAQGMMFRNPSKLSTLGLAVFMQFIPPSAPSYSLLLSPGPSYSLCLHHNPFCSILFLPTHSLPPAPTCYFLLPTSPSYTLTLHLLHHTFPCSLLLPPPGLAPPALAHCPSSNLNRGHLE